MLKYWGQELVNITKIMNKQITKHRSTLYLYNCTYRGVIGADGVASENGVDPKALSGGVGVVLDVQDAALLEVVHVSSLHLQRA
jgi:hypothetical protein